MRFQKLRVSVGISLIVFMFVVSNILISGLVMKNGYAAQNLPDQNVVITPEVRKLVPQQDIITSTTPEVVNPPPAPKPVVVTPLVRTRAS